MDILGGLHVVYFTCDTIQAFIKKYPKYEKNKKFNELFIGCLISRIIKKNTGNEFLVGVPLKTNYNHGNSNDSISLLDLLENSNLIDDEDVDLVLSYDGNPESPITQVQLTRLVSNNKDRFDLSSLKRLLEKKSKVEDDKTIYLVINVEARISINIDNIDHFIRTKHIPFGKILLVGITNDIYHDYTIYEIFPEFAEYGPNDLD